MYHETSFRNHVMNNNVTKVHIFTFSWGLHQKVQDPSGEVIPGVYRFGLGSLANPRCRRHRKSSLPARAPKNLNMILFNKSVGNFQYDHMSTITNDSKDY